jgi:6-phosphogluconolactonase/glucosamine-6-phosphate isomerase/deaminase
MKYIYVTDTEPVIQYLTDTIMAHLTKGEKVLWVLSGGSGGKVCIEVSKRLTGNLSGLITTLSDERYVPVGDPDENWQQLIDGGFSIPGATTYRPLQGLDREATAERLGVWIKDQTAVADYKIGLFGMGADGHTAGIKPQTSAVEATGWATSFTGNDFERITMTFDAIKQLDEIVVQAMGADKTEALDILLHQDIPMTVQPAQILKSVAKSTIFTDYKEDK